MWNGSPWHLNKNAVILAEFEDCMRPDELKFDRLQVWARILNLPYNLRDDAWALTIARQLDKNVQIANFDHIGGYLRARVTIEVDKPLRRWILIDSARRKKVDSYDIQYEQIPYFCFSCGRLGHSELYCPTPGTRDANGDLSFGPKLRASDDYKNAASSQGSTKEQSSEQNSKNATKNSSSKVDAGEEVTSPIKPRNPPKRKEAPHQVYRPVAKTLLLLTSGKNGGDTGTSEAPPAEINDGTDGEGREFERDPKKKRPTPENSAETVSRSCPAQ